MLLMLLLPSFPPPEYIYPGVANPHNNCEQPTYDDIV